MFRDTAKACEGLRFLVSEYENYRLKLFYDEECNPILGLYRVRRKGSHEETFAFVKWLSTTDILEQCAEISEGLLDE